MKEKRNKMQNAIDSLMQQVPPPEHPIEAKGNWGTVETTLGMLLPNDYKSIIGMYGTGSFFDFLWIHNPFSANDNLNLCKAAAVTMKGLKKHSKKSLAMSGPDPFLQTLLELIDSREIFPCGSTDNGHDIFWRTKGDPDRWTLMILSYRGQKSKAFNLSLSEFLLAVALKKVNYSVFPQVTSMEFRPV